MKKLFIMIVALAGLTVLNAGLMAQEVNPKKQIVSKEIVGTVSGVSGNFIAVVYGRDQQSGILSEMAFNVGKNVKIKNKKALKDIGPEDTVKVLYDEITEKLDGGRKIVSHAAKEIVFLRAADKKAVTQQGEEAQVLTE